MESMHTALHGAHLALHAKMVPFAGFDMPVSYLGIQAEHMSVRTKAGLFDVSHMGEFIIKGHDATAFLQQITTNDVSKLQTGMVQYSCMTHEDGGIVDDLLVYRLDASSYMMVVNAGNIQKDWTWINQWKNGHDVTLHNISDRTSLLALQGPLATEIMRRAMRDPLPEIPYYTFTRGRVGAAEDTIISATGYTGSGGFELYVANAQASALWDHLMEIGAPLGLVPAGLGARDTLRLEMGYCLYGNDIDETTHPLEAGLGWITRTNKKFIGSSSIAAAKEKGVTRKLSGFTMGDKAVPRKGYVLLDKESNAIGRVTSGTFSPLLNQGIGMGYIDVKHLQTDLYVDIRNRAVPAKIVKFPFIKI